MNSAPADGLTPGWARPCGWGVCARCLAASLGISEHVKLAGFVSNPYPYMARASVFAVSSLWEGASNVVIEALAAGTPVVAYRCPTGIAEVVAPEGLVAPGDVAGLAAAILMQVSRPRPAEVFKAQAARYSLAASLEAYVELFRKTLDVPHVQARRSNAISPA